VSARLVVFYLFIIYDQANATLPILGKHIRGHGEQGLLVTATVQALTVGRLCSSFLLGVWSFVWSFLIDLEIAN
jgi:hypothetical protein